MFVTHRTVHAIYRKRTSNGKYEKCSASLIKKRQSK